MINQTEALNKRNSKFSTSDLAKVRPYLLNGSLLAIVILTLQNGFVFFNHYFRGYVFPWDFHEGFFPVVTYWISLVAQGYFPTWMPYAQMGYPVEFALQSGMHYPPYWIIPLLQIEYNFHTAVVFQTSHVLLGAVGMFVFLRGALKSTPYALIGAFAFQFFGGFYSNAEHSDIIRAYAFTPWFFYAVYLEDDLKIRARHFAIPLLTMLVATGAYLGNLAATGFMIGVFVLAQWVAFYIAGADRKKLLINAAIVLGFAGIGAGLSFFHLAPGLFYIDSLYRSSQQLYYLGLGPEFLPGLFLNNNFSETEISMTSTYITLPMLMLAVFPARQELKRWWPMIAVGLVSVAMVAGPQSAFWYFVTRLVPQLKLSRFPSSDYRIFIGMVLIFFAVIGFKTLLESRISRMQFFTRLGVISFWILQLLYIIFNVQRIPVGWLNVPPFVNALTMLVLSTILFTITIYWPKKQQTFANISVLALVGLIALDAYHVIPNMITWQDKDVLQRYQAWSWPLEENGRVMAPVWLMEWPEQRPSRIVKPNKSAYSWEGYITGRYILQDKVPFVLKASHEVAVEPVYLDYMSRAWTPLFFDPQRMQQGDKNIPVVQLKEKISSFDPQSYQSVHQTLYGINTINYQISINSPTVMVENEIYFPGWTAKLYQGGKLVDELNAFPTNRIFRSWQLPPGNYQMVTSFQFPNIWIFRGVSIAALIIYLAVLVGGWRLRKRSWPSLNTAEVG